MKKHKSKIQQDIETVRGIIHSLEGNNIKVKLNIPATKDDIIISAYVCHSMKSNRINIAKDDQVDVEISRSDLNLCRIVRRISKGVHFKPS